MHIEEEYSKSLAGKVLKQLAYLSTQANAAESILSVGRMGETVLMERR